MVETDSAGSSSRPWLVILAVLAGVGFAVAADLALLHWQVHNLPGHVSFCAISEGVNCDTVALSPASIFLGLPVAVWAALFFLLVLVLALWGCLFPQDGFPAGILLLLFSLAWGGTVFLALTSHLVIRSLCIMCMFLYLVNLASGCLLLLAGRRTAFGAAFSLALLAGGALVGALLFSLVNPASAASAPVLGVEFLLLLLVFAGAWKMGRRTAGSFWNGFIVDLRRIFIPVWRGGLLLAIAGAALICLLVFYPRLYTDVYSLDFNKRAETLPTGRSEGGHPWIGAEKPQLVITEYSDYECPFCREAHQLVRDLVTDNSGWLRLVHVHVPLDMACNPMIRRPFHRNACACARAAICADRQGAFWRMNDSLFAHRCNLDEGGLTVLAGRLGLDVDSFRKCLVDPQTHEKLRADLNECIAVAQECREAGMAFGTPTFTVGGKVVVGLKDRAYWERLLAELRLRPQAE